MTPSSPLCNLVLSALVVLGLWANPVQASSFSQLFFFGDSFTDTGNLLFGMPTNPDRPDPALGYYRGRWQEGPAWSDYFAGLAGESARASSLAGTNYAVGGAFSGPFPGEPVPLVFPGEGFFYLQSQVDSFMFQQRRVADPNALYSLIIGNNDFPVWGRTPDEAEASAGVAVGAVEQLMAAGAQHFFVSPLGVTGDPAQDEYRRAFDAALVGMLDALVTAGADITIFDIASYQAGFLSGDRFAELGITDPGACLDNPGCAAAAAADRGTGDFRHEFYTFDGTHLNTILHEDFAEAAYDFAEAGFETVIPEPSTTLLLGLGFVGFGVRRAFRAGAGSS